MFHIFCLEVTIEVGFSLWLFISVWMSWTKILFIFSFSQSLFSDRFNQRFRHFVKPSPSPSPQRYQRKPRKTIPYYYNSGMFSYIFLKTFNAFLKKFQKHFQDRVVVTNLLTKPLWLTRKDNKILIMEGRNEMLSKILHSQWLDFWKFSNFFNWQMLQKYSSNTTSA